MSVPRPVRTAAAVVTVSALCLGLAACGGADSKSDPAASRTPAKSSSGAGKSVGPGGTARGGAAAGGSLAAVTVGAGTTPKVRLPQTPFTLTTTSVRVLTPGRGAPVVAGQNVKVRLALVDGRDGSQSVSTFDKAPQVFLADASAGLPGFVKGAVGQRIGSRVLVGLAPQDAFGDNGNAQIGVQPGDTVLLVMDLVSAHAPLAAATGTVVAPKAGLPTVTGARNPTVTVPKIAAPTTLISQPLIRGTGPIVKAGQTLTAHYTGVLWKDGKKFDSSWDRKMPSNFVIGGGRVIPGWDKTIVGQRIGTRLLLVVPPAEGYGTKGTGDGTITGTDTLVFVVDLLDAG